MVCSILWCLRKIIPCSAIEYKYHIFLSYSVCPLGAHVDHLHGIVIDFSLDKGVDFWFTLSDGRHIHLESLTFEGTVDFNINKASQVKDYVCGTKYALRKRFTLKYRTEINETRLGVVMDLLLAIDSYNVDDDMMVLAADNIFNFSLQGFVDFFKEKGTFVNMCHYEPELKKLQRTGMIAVDENMKVLEM